MENRMEGRREEGKKEEESLEHFKDLLGVHVQSQ